MKVVDGVTIKTGGRRRGSRNLTDKDVRKVFATAFKEIGGKEALTEWAKKNPTDFFKLFARAITIDSRNSEGINATVEQIQSDISQIFSGNIPMDAPISAGVDSGQEQVEDSEQSETVGILDGSSV